MSGKNKKLEVQIAGRKYPLIINQDEEGRVKEMIGEINKKVSDFQLKYGNKDRQDHLAMLLLTTYNELTKLKTGRDEEAVLQRLTKMEDDLTSLI